MMMCGIPSASTSWTRLDQFAQESTLSQLECDACVQALLSPQSDLILAHATTMLATDATQDSTLSHNEFALCLRVLLRPSLALSPSEFAACMRALISPPVPPVPAGIRQHGSRLGDEVLHTSRILRRLLSDNIPHPDDILLAFPPQNVLYPLHVIEYSDDTLLVFPSPNPLYPLAPIPDFSITITVTLEVLLVWFVLFR